MTKVTFSLQEDKILAVDILGHAGYAEEGEDIVCAAISSAVMLTHALLYDVQHIPVDTGCTLCSEAAFFRTGTKLF